jgi:hypothetical protein
VFQEEDKTKKNKLAQQFVFEVSYANKNDNLLIRNVQKWFIPSIEPKMPLGGKITARKKEEGELEFEAQGLLYAFATTMITNGDVKMSLCEWAVGLNQGSELATKYSSRMLELGLHQSTLETKELRTREDLLGEETYERQALTAQAPLSSVEAKLETLKRNLDALRIKLVTLKERLEALSVAIQDLKSPVE